METLYRATLRSLPLVGSGKVRDIYAVGDDRLLMVTSDRLSAFDVVMSEPIPGKGHVLNSLALFWFDRLTDIIPNHLTGIDPSEVVASDEVAQVRGRSMVVRRLQPILVEAVVRGYLAGSGYKEYGEQGGVSGVVLPAGLRLAEKLPEPIFTPAAKAAMGEHDENISFERMVETTGRPLAERIRETSIALYRRASEHAASRGIIIADTKFEFGLDADGSLCLMDEVLTPDSSRFWPASEYRVGISPPSYDKQFVRDYLETVPGWNKRAPPPPLPPEVIAATAARYREALARLTGAADDAADRAVDGAAGRIGA
jgi:phosphoribosylaminoimidazole-succinocarboxamide synthase